ncbi:uncharacterized protein PG998_012179 [Apiospora kogelbergensis]|uniref:uncharacterized protein n=1 Tax=Apiospora kogelbergensis TaxID=1337665 RepID=UPI0031302D14
MTQVFCLVLLLIGTVLGQRFVSPGESSGPQPPGSSLSNTVYSVGSHFYIAWENANKTRQLSIVLFQLDGEELVYPFEYIEQRLTGRSTIDWTVATSKDLSFSSNFLLNMFYDGDSKPVAVSKRFNITDTRKTSTSTTSTSLISTSGLISTPPTSTAASTPALVATSSAPEHATDDGAGGEGLSTGAKAGIGVAVPVVALLGIGAGYFLNKYRTSKARPPTTWGADPGQIPMSQKRQKVLHPGKGYSTPHELYTAPTELYSSPPGR